MYLSFLRRRSCVGRERLNARDSIRSGLRRLLACYNRACLGFFWVLYFVFFFCYYRSMYMILYDTAICSTVFWQPRRFHSVGSVGKSLCTKVVASEGLSNAGLCTKLYISPCNNKLVLVRSSETPRRELENH